MNPAKQISSSLIEKIKAKLLGRFKKIEGDITDLERNDPFTREAGEGFRNEDELGDEVQDKVEHEISEAIKSELKAEEKSIKKSISKMNAGTYGYCIKCGKAIDEKRLKANPTAEYCMSCENKIAK